MANKFKNNSSGNIYSMNKSLTEGTFIKAGPGNTTWHGHVGITRKVNIKNYTKV